MNNIVKNKSINLPDFLIVGAAKSGTTSLYHYLNQHPDIFMPKDIKETLFFHITTNPNKEQQKFLKRSVDSFEEYCQLFAEAKEEQKCGEVCPSYLYFYDHTISNIKKFHPNWENLKILIILREPVSKIISHYHFVTNTLKIKDKSLDEALKLEKERLTRNDVLIDLFYQDNTRYVNQVKAFQRNFKNVKVFLYDDLLESPSKLMIDICEFLEVDSSFIPDNLSEKFNKSSRRKVHKNSFSKFVTTQSFLSPLKQIFPSTLKSVLKQKLYTEEKIDSRTINYLKDSFRSEVISLEELIGQDLSNRWGY